MGVNSHDIALLSATPCCSIPLIKRVNNIVSDHSLATRDSLYVPVGGLDSIDCKLVAYLHCHHAKRRFIVVLRDGEQPPPVAAMPASVQDRALKQLTNMFQRGATGLGGNTDILICFLSSSAALSLGKVWSTQGRHILAQAVAWAPFARQLWGSSSHSSMASCLTRAMMRATS